MLKRQRRHLPEEENPMGSLPAVCLADLLHGLHACD